MKKNMNKNLEGIKHVVLWISLLFIFCTFTPAMTCPNNPLASGSNPLPLLPSETWWNEDWNYRKEITIDHSKVAANLTDFPVVINLNSDADLANNAQDDGDDIIFIANSDIHLNHELESFCGSTGDLVAWVNVTSLSSIEDTTFYMYYGNPDCGNQQNTTGVWDSGFVMVQHLNENSDTHYDSTSYDNDGTPQNGVNQNSDGKFDGADEFDGDDDFINCGNDLSFNFTSYLSIEAWVNFTEIGNGTWQGIVTKNDFRNWAFAVGGTKAPGKAVIFITGASGGTSGDVISKSPINDGLWHHIMATFNGTLTRIFVDGVEENTSTTLVGPTNTSTKNVLIGHYETLPRPFNGSIDEVRISKVTRDDDWIMTEYNNQYEPNMFYSVGSEETLNGYVYPIADFTYSPTFPSPNETVQFTDTSTDSDGTIVSWFWDFGDGNTSTEQNPNKNYTQGGIFTVILNVTDDDGLTNETSQNISIITTAVPIADFTYSPVSPTDLEDITFIDNSSDADGYITSWYWDFGDDNTSEEENPVHQYVDNGTYKVTLTVTDNSTVENETTQYITVKNVPPTANFTYLQLLPEVNESVQFTDTSVDLDGTIISWFWDFGDGNTSTEQNPQNTYSSFDIYTVTLNVSDNDGDTNEISMNVIIKVTYKEVIDPGVNEVDLKSEADITVNINVTNSTNITIVVFSGNPTNEDIPININSVGKYIDISVENESVIVWPIEIKIYYTQDDLNNSGIEEYQLLGIYYWNESAEEWQLYSDTGVNTNYDENGYEGYCWANAWHLTNLCMGADADPPSKVTGLTVVDAKDGKLNLAWNVANDNVAVDYYKVYRDSIFLTTTISTSYQDTGLTNLQVYSYEISAVDTTGNEGEKSDSVSGTPTASGSAPPAPPSDRNPIADAGGPYYGPINHQITFDGSGSSDDVKIEKYEWDFGDGTTGTGISPTHTYTTEGNFTVKLTVTDNVGKKGTDTTFAVISGPLNNPPYLPTINGPQKLTKNIQYNYAINAIDIDNDNIRYVIDWGDGEDLTTEYMSSGTVYNANHTWDTSGIFTITLYAEDNLSRSGNINLNVYVDIPIMYIDGEIQGYLIDSNNDGIYDKFYNNLTGKETDVEKQIDGTYLINSDLDEDWDYIFDLDIGTLTIYDNSVEEEKIEDNTMLYIITVVIVFVILIIIGILVFKKEKTQKQ